MLDLFSGIGGFSLAASWTGAIETVAFCEIETYCQKVLQKNFPGIPIFSDITRLRGEDIGAVDIVCGGDPCQPYSCAGKRRGKEDDRYLWPEYFRIIQELRPPWIVRENVPGNDGMGLDKVLSDLESIGYETAPPLEIPACSVGSQSLRYRIYVVAHSDSQRCNTSKDEARMVGKTSPGKQKQGARVLRDFRGYSGRIWQAPESIFERVDYGISSELDRLRGLGNAIVPQVVYPILAGIVEIEQEAIADGD